MCRARTCEDCGDRLIHQHHRGQHESSSAFGQFLHDEVTKQTSIVDVDEQALQDTPLELVEAQIHQLHFVFGDIQRLRVLEHKRVGDGLSQAQRWILPVWRRLIHLGIQDRHISTSSGLYLIEADPPFDEFAVTKFSEFEVPDYREMKRHEFIEWMGGAR